MSPSLDSPRLKLDRADEHLDVLDEELRVFLNCYTERLSSEHALDGPWHIVLVNPPANELPPPRLSLICGDAIQNLRAVLDHIVWQLVLLEGNRPDKWNSFPVYTNKEQFDANVRHPKNPKRRPSPLHGIDPNGRAWELIEKVQPYRRRLFDQTPELHELAFLTSLSNIDKHRTLMSQMMFPGKATLGDILSFNPDAMMLDYKVALQPFSLEEKTEVIRVRFSETGSDPQVRVKPNLPVNPSFGDGSTLQVPIRTIKQIRTYVRGFIDYFDEFF